VHSGGMNSQEAFIEKLETAHEFPTRYTFKLIGASDGAFQTQALELLSRHYPNAEPDVSTRASAKGNHVSMTVVATMPDAPTVARLYQAFHRLDGLAMLL